MSKLLLSRIALLIGCQAFLCWLEVYLISKISLIGKIGIAAFYHQYRILRSDWKTFLILFSLQVILIAVLLIIKTKTSRRILVLVTSILLLIGVMGLGVTFQDFMLVYSHRLLKERFHLGFYLFWVG